MFAFGYFALFLAVSAPVLAGPVDRRSKSKHNDDDSDKPSTYTEWNDDQEPTSTWNDQNGPAKTVTVTVTVTAGQEPESEPTESPENKPCKGNCYDQSKNWVGSSWLEDGDDDWEFFDRRDPTHGRVDYVDRNRAAEANLTHASSDSFIMRADSWTKLKSGGSGRESVRINTKKMYTTYTSVIDVRHMPEGEGVWPAYWTVGNDWPNKGELDIIEGVNNDANNLMSLHTSDGCTQPKEGRLMSGNVGYHDCNVHGAKGNQGCGVRAESDKSFGPNFNKNGGGWYGTERTDKYIKVWFWARDDENVPADVRDNTGSVGPDNWGTPAALFVSDNCELDKKFGPNKFVINLTLCGDWAGNGFDGGKRKCEEHVNKHPEAFENAYWDIARMTLYEKQ